MAVQILGLREYIDKKSGKKKKAHRFFKENWRAPSIQHILQNIDEILEEIPEEEHYNLYFTAADCHDDAPRHMNVQNIIPIDIDGISPEDLAKPDAYVAVICDALKIKPEDTGVVFTGNGLQFHIGLNEPIQSNEYFEKNRHYYKAMCGYINQTLYSYKLSGEADTQVWTPARLLRLPNTKNIKPDKGLKHSYVINDTIKRIDFKISDHIGLTQVDEGDFIHPKAMSKLPVDTAAVEQGCDFLRYCKANQDTISEPQWYAMLSIVARLDNGVRLVHEYSKDHPEYDADETDFKAQQAIDASGPRTCKNIDTLWDGCSNCDYYGVCRSPITIKSEEFIATKDTGFYEMSIDRHGNEKRGKPSYDDLAKFFAQSNPYSTAEQGGIVHVFTGKKWEDVSRNRIHNFAELNFDPKPTNGMCQEFEAKLKRTNLQQQEWYQPQGKINFNNGILDIVSNAFESHSPEYGFKYVLPFDYDPDADCPRFRQFLEEVTCGREDLSKVVLEFMGYSVAGIDPALGQKALILHGDGANGKSVLIDVFKMLGGEGNYSSLSMGGEINRLENRYQLSGKLFNVSEETPSGAMVDSSVFKALVSGGEVQARKLYCDAFSMRNFAKIIMACNELPRTADLSHGMLRRLLIVPFDAKFDGEARDIYLADKLATELSGIFNLCMEGYRRFLQQGRFTESDTVESSVRKYTESNDNVLQFVLDQCSLGVEKKAATSGLYSSYTYFCEDNRYRNIAPKIEFSRRLKKIIQKETGITDAVDRFYMNGKQVRGFKGISLVEEGGAY